MVTQLSEGPDVTELREMLALASRARRWRAIIATVKTLGVLGFFAAVGWVVYHFA